MHHFQHFHNFHVHCQITNVQMQTVRGCGNGTAAERVQSYTNREELYDCTCYKHTLV